MVESVNGTLQQDGGENEHRINRAVDRAVEILHYVAQKKAPVSLAEVSKALVIPKSSAFDILYTLAEKRMLKFLPDSKSFQLDVRTFEIGSSYLGGNEVHIVARPLLKRLSQKTGETAFLAVENNGMIVYLDKVEGTSPTRTTCVIGDRNTMYNTGLGKAILATKPIEEVRRITGGGNLYSKTERTLGHFNDLIEDLEKTRMRGYSIDDREDVELVFCLGAPILNQAGNCIAAVSVAAIFSQSFLENLEAYSKMVMEGALEISRSLGYLGGSVYPSEGYR